MNTPDMLDDFVSLCQSARIIQDRVLVHARQRFYIMNRMNDAIADGRGELFFDATRDLADLASMMAKDSEDMMKNLIDIMEFIESTIGLENRSG